MYNLGYSRYKKTEKCSQREKCMDMSSQRVQDGVCLGIHFWQHKKFSHFSDNVQKKLVLFKSMYTANRTVSEWSCNMHTFLSYYFVLVSTTWEWMYITVQQFEIITRFKWQDTPVYYKIYSKITVDKNCKNPKMKKPEWKIGSFVSEFTNRTLTWLKCLHLLEEEGFVTIHNGGNINWWWWWWYKLLCEREYGSKKVVISHM